MRQLTNSREVFYLDLHEMGMFHEGMIKIFVLRVPGGWIYSTGEAGNLISSPTFNAFVPFINDSSGTQGVIGVTGVRGETGAQGVTGNQGMTGNIGNQNPNFQFPSF